MNVLVLPTLHGQCMRIRWDPDKFTAIIPTGEHESMLVYDGMLLVDKNYPSDKRKQRRYHRHAARNLLNNGGVFNHCSARGTSFHSVASWHLGMARNI